MAQSNLLDSILALRSRTENSTPSPEKPGLAELPLTGDPTHLRVEPSVKRSIAKVPQELLAIFRSLVDAKAPWPLFLFGSQGRGKTCAALCLLDYTAKLGGFERWSYTTPYRLSFLLEQARAGRLGVSGTHSGATVWPEGLFDRIGRTPLFVLDDMGTRDVVSPAQYDLVKEVIDRRQGKPLIVTSNLDAAALTKCYDARLVSRVAAGTVFELRGEDRRLQD